MKKEHFPTKASITLLIGLLISVSIFQVGIVKASSNVIGTISSDTVWTKANSPYTLAGPVAVNTGVTLTIEPGVIVNLNNYYIQVNGTLVARGSINDRINMTGGEIIFTELSKSWNETTLSGSIFESTNYDKITIKNVSPKINRVSGGNIGVYNSSLSISNSQLGITIYSGSPTISNNNITGMYILQGSPVISKNIITEGVTFENPSSFAVPNLNDTPVITNNNITSWYGAVLSLSGCSPVIANNNIIGLSKDLGPRRGYFGESYGVYSAYYGINFDNGNASIINNVIMNCSVGISIVTGSSAIEKNLIYSNSIYGIGLGSEATDRQNTNGRISIQKNTIANNPQAIKLYRAPPVTVNYNNIQDYIGSISLKSTASDINATYDWWGTTNETQISQSIFDFKNDFNLGKVNYVPFLNAPNPDAPAIPIVPPTNSSSSAPSTSPVPSSEPSPIPNDEPLPSQNSTGTEPTDQTDNQSLSQEEILEVAVAILVTVVVALSVIVVGMHRKSRTKKNII